MVKKEGNAHRLRTVPCLSFTQKEGKHFPSNTVVHISLMFARFNFLQEPFHMSFTCAEGESERSASKLECLSDVLQTSEALPLLCVQKSKILFKKMSD